MLLAIMICHLQRRKKNERKQQGLPTLFSQSPNITQAAGGQSVGTGELKGGKTDKQSRSAAFSSCCMLMQKNTKHCDNFNKRSQIIENVDLDKKPPIFFLPSVVGVAAAGLYFYPTFITLSAGNGQPIP